MNRLISYPFVLALFVGVPMLVADAPAQPLAPRVQKSDDGKTALEKFLEPYQVPIRIRESKPVTVKNAQFVVVAQTDWQPGKPNDHFPTVAPLELQLRITNLSKEDVLFPTAGTFGLRIFTEDGKRVQPRDGPNGVMMTRPILLSGGESFALCRCAELYRNKKAKASELVYYDGTGARTAIGPLEPGHYKLVFWYSVPPAPPAIQKGAKVATWVGEVVTNEVWVEVTKATTRGYPPAFRWPEEVLKEPVRIQQSKAVILKDAKFVLVAQGEWKPAKHDKGVHLQLHITNLSKSNLLFPTHSTFSVTVLNAAGKRLMDRGGSDIMILTRPLLLRAGASFALGDGGVLFDRRSELRWDGITKTAEFVYNDGSGWRSVLGPLKPGRYKLVFRYHVSHDHHENLKKNIGDVAFWQGSVVLEVFIEVRDR